MKETNNESKMKEYGIVCEVKKIYRFKEHSYDKLDDAIRYAKSVRQKNDKAG